jgi:hypothetical protein
MGEDAGAAWAFAALERASDANGASKSAETIKRRSGWRWVML